VISPGTAGRWFSAASRRPLFKAGQKAGTQTCLRSSAATADPDRCLGRPGRVRQPARGLLGQYRRRTAPVRCGRAGNASPRCSASSPHPRSWPWRSTLASGPSQRRRSSLGCGTGSIPIPTRSSSSCPWSSAAGWSGTAFTTSSPSRPNIRFPGTGVSGNAWSYSVASIPSAAEFLSVSGATTPSG
jgi:hypothetical protein